MSKGITSKAIVMVAAFHRGWQFQLGTSNGVLMTLLFDPFIPFDKTSVCSKGKWTVR